MEKLESYQLNEGEVAMFGYFRSSASFRVRISLAFKKIPFKYIAVHLLKGDQKSGDFAKINPTGLVPALWIDGHLLAESMAIVEYLEETRKDTRALLPADPLKKAKVREICEHINSGMQPLINLRVLGEVDKLKGDKLAWAIHWITVGLQSLEKILAQSAGKYCVGDEVTLADAFLVPQMWASYVRFKIDKSLYPTIARIYDALAELPEVQDSMPEKQPDYDPSA